MHFQLGGEPPKQTWEMLVGLHLSSYPIDEQDIPRLGQEEEEEEVWWDRMELPALPHTLGKRFKKIKTQILAEHGNKLKQINILVWDQN